MTLVFRHCKGAVGATEAIFKKSRRFKLSRLESALEGSRMIASSAKVHHSSSKTSREVRNDTIVVDH